MQDISGAQMLIALVIGLAVLILLILKSRLHVFIALILSACIIGLTGGMPPLRGRSGDNQRLRKHFGAYRYFDRNRFHARTYL